jgi:flagellar assembly protein FliH
LSKKFISGHFPQEIERKESFEMAWPTLSPRGDAFSFHPGLKELEARVLKEVRERGLLIEKEAYEKGFEQGEKDGRELGLKRLEMVIHQFGNVFAEIERQRRGFRQAYESEMLTLVLGIGKRIFRQELLFHEEVIIAILREAFQYVTDRGKVIVRLNPGDYQYLLAHPGEVPFSLDGNDGVKMIEDPSITRGGCLLETSFGEVDATFESQFDEMVSLVRRQMDGAGRHPDQ